MQRDVSEIKGIKIPIFNICAIICACVLIACLFFATIHTSKKYEELLFDINNYIELEKQAERVHEASAYLTDQVRLYVKTMDVTHAELYFEEANVTQRRESALSELENHYLSDPRGIHIQEAVQNSNNLMEREIYAMKLVSVAQGYDMSTLPAEIQAMPLEAEDAALSAEAMIQKAQSMVNDTDYTYIKAVIHEKLYYFTQNVLHTTEGNLIDGLDGLLDAIATQRMMMVLLVLVNILTFVVITLLIVRPLRVWLRCIRERMPFESIGAYEFKYLAQVYNDIYRQNAAISANEMSLKHKAEHDPLTGLRNRLSYNQVSSILKESSTPLALLMMDVDEFKTINDVYGHKAGDEVLKQVATLLKDNFRSKDYLFRIGGDEFAIIVMDLTSDQAYVIEKSLSRINAALQEPSDGLPAVSLSAGAAFSAKGYQDVLYEQADRALYWVKKNGRGGCRLYHDE